MAWSENRDEFLWWVSCFNNSTNGWAHSGQVIGLFQPFAMINASPPQRESHPAALAKIGDPDREIERELKFAVRGSARIVRDSEEPSRGFPSERVVRIPKAKKRG